MIRETDSARERRLEQVADLVRATAKARGLTQAMIASRAGVSVPTYTRTVFQTSTVQETNWVRLAAISSVLGWHSYVLGGLMQGTIPLDADLDALPDTPPLINTVPESRPRREHPMPRLFGDASKTAPGPLRREIEQLRARVAELEGSQQKVVRLEGVLATLMSELGVDATAVS